MTDTAHRDAVDPRLEGAVALVRRLPLRWFDNDEGKPAESVIARGWFSGADECARVLATQAPLETCWGRGFGVRWPILRDGAWTVAPALPVAVAGEAAVGVDGEYRGDATSVWREAGGTEDLFLTSDLSQPPPGVPFDLLWFGDFERFTVRDGTLEIEDLFGILRVPANPQILDRLLIRSRRMAGEAMVGLPLTDRVGPQTIEVRRADDLSQADRWRDASTFLAARADIESTTSRGATIEARLVGGATAIFQRDEDQDGWLLTLRDGRYVFGEIRGACCENSISLCATLTSEVDAMAPGMRGRLIFDLRTDLVTLG
ncbi:MAG: hypothetical protein OQK55_00910 [Thermoanaerobaculales bacterium]|nr:hypothetical protein [Thermoanaerobaculales bacterium]